MFLFSGQIFSLDLSRILHRLEFASLSRIFLHLLRNEKVNKSSLVDLIIHFQLLELPQSLTSKWCEPHSTKVETWVKIPAIFRPWSEQSTLLWESPSWEGEEKTSNHPFKTWLKSYLFSLMGGVQLFSMIKMLGLQHQHLGPRQNELAWRGYQVNCHYHVVININNFIRFRCGFWNCAFALCWRSSPRLLWGTIPWKMGELEDIFFVTN